MKKFILAGGILVLILTLVLVGGSLLLPGEFAIERSAAITGTPAQIYALAGHLDTWPEWTPWNGESYVGMEISFPGRTEGLGAVQVWTLGETTGRLEVTSAEEARGLSYDLAIEGGPRIEGIISFEAGPSEGEAPVTRVRWQQRGPLDGVFARWIGLTLERSLGGDLEKALAGLEARIGG